MDWRILFIIVLPVMNGYSQDPKHTATVELEGVLTYYEVYGSGQPLFLLHGFTQSSKSWAAFLDDYTNEYEVYLVDLLGHGNSSPFTAQLSVKAAAKNLLNLIQHLKLDSIRAIGYSYGGEILFQLALLRPDLLQSMVIIGSCGSWDAKDFPEFVDYLSYQNIDNLPWMREQQLNEDRIRNILGQVPYYSISVSDNELRGIKVRTLLVAGDHDHATPLQCLINVKANMPNVFLWIVPNAEHRPHRDANKDLFVSTSKRFLSERDW